MQLAFSRLRDGLFLHGAVDCDRLEVFGIDGLSVHARLNGHRQQPLTTGLADPLAPLGQRGRVARQPVLEETLAAEVLLIRIFDP